MIILDSIYSIDALRSVQSAIATMHNTHKSIPRNSMHMILASTEASKGAGPSKHSYLYHFCEV